MKVGDKVKIVSSIYGADSLQPGKTGRIVNIVADYSADVIMDDDHPDSSGALDWPFEFDELEVIQ